MAEIIGGGTPANDWERRVIAHLRDNAPEEWLVLHNIEIPVRGDAYEVDLVVVTGHAVCVIDAKGTRGRIDVAGFRWYPEGRDSFASPVRKLRSHARALKGLLERGNAQLAQVYVDHLVVLPDDSRLVDRSDRPDADAVDVTDLAGLIPALRDVSRVRSGMARDIRPHMQRILTALSGVRRPTGPRRFGHWVVTERLGGDDEVTEYRARNATAGGSATVRLRVYRADPFLSEPERAAQRIAIANAYAVLENTPSSDYVVGLRDFFAVEDESQFVLVLDDVRGQALTVLLADPRRPLGADAALQVVTDMLRGLAHSHAHSVLHRALTPSSVLVAGSGRAMLTGFDYARPEGPRDHSVVQRLADALDPAYVAPECQRRAQAMTRASDVYAAGVIAFQLLTGELPFETSSDQFRLGSVLPAEPMASAGLSPELIDLLRRMCALAPSNRPAASEALRDMVRITRPGRRPVPPGSAAVGGTPDLRNLPQGHQLTRKFTIRRRLGNPGSFGTAYQAYDSLAGVDRVVKVVHRDRESVVERLRLEYKILLRLPPHPSVVQVQEADYLDGGDIPYLVFEYVDGQVVSRLVETRTLGPADVVQLGIDVAEGLAYLHDNGIFHCDIKPSNLLRTDAGCKIFDFNVAVTDDSSHSRTGGTSRYTPADFGGAGQVTRVDLVDRDVYALGLTLYEVLAGRWPFSDQARVGVKPVDPRDDPDLCDLSDELVATLLKAIAPVRSERYGSAQEFLAALRAIGDRVHRAPEPMPEPVDVPAATVGVNSFVTHLQTLYSQSTRSNAGTRGGWDPRYDLYVETALDRRLTAAVLRGAHRMVIITGNAGDGKTAYLERLLRAAAEDGPRQPIYRDNGADFQLPNGHWLRTNHDGSQDQAGVANDEVLQAFFAPFRGDNLSGAAGETRLIAINEGRLVDFLDTHRTEFPALRELVRAELEGGGSGDGIAVINLNQRSLLSDQDGLDASVFDRMLTRLTHPKWWEACDSCDLVSRCYARHNALSFAHASAGPKVTGRLRTLYRLTELRGTQHLTIRDLQSALAFMLTSGRDCTQIHELYAGGQVEEVLDGFYFNSWAGTPGTSDRLLRLLAQVDVAPVADPPLDRRLDYVGPDAGRAMMTIDQRGDYDLQMLTRMADRLPRGTAIGPATAATHRRYLAAARRRFYFECVDDERAERMLPYRAAREFADILAQPAAAPERLPELIAALNRSEGFAEPDRLGGALALQVRVVPGGTIRSYRLFPASELALTVTGAADSPYLEGRPQELALSHHGAGGHQARLRIRLDLFELLSRLRDGYLPGVAERQGLHLGLTIFKHELSSAPYQEVLLTVTGQELWRISREPDGRLRMEQVSSSEGGSDGPASG